MSLYNVSDLGCGLRIIKFAFLTYGFFLSIIICWLTGAFSDYLKVSVNFFSDLLF